MKTMPEVNFEQTTPKSSSSPKLLLIVLGIFALVGAAAYAGYCYGKQQVPPPATTPEVTTPPVTEVPEATPPAEVDETAGWKSYTNIRYRYSVKLPKNWGVWSIESGKWEFSESISSSKSLVLLGDYEGPPTVTQDGIIIVPQKIDVAVHLATSKSGYIDSMQKPEGDCSELPVKISSGLTWSKVLCPGYHSVTFLLEKGTDLYRITKGVEFAEFDQILSTFKFLE